ncbi:putative membrane protein YphA (DoxX/SURF4 family) [Desulfobaculum xiamenense]|uniref:Putative membrane protein YphA (DoxX/SURF4 family) n=1 Tax=Desulfobaculum xiamenense TaxID=995050 RepID=A0A846QH83_9BACT|nr:MauE/DoxX family redox-associated membrane protein [Desulfobaculum xiamenense]NJB67638.1 putative membrane protein YphA (DoxX/SURF4 family) [Desulfobaculum xiamenense]
MRTNTTHPTGFARVILSPLLYRAARYTLAAIFVYAGIGKLADPAAFAQVIAGYGLLPGPLVPIVALLLPALEVAAGAGLVFDLRGSLASIGGMNLVFLFVLAYGMHLGLDVDCGCYGPGDPEGEAYHGLKEAFIRDMGLMALVIHAYWWRRVRGVRPLSIPAAIHILIHPREKA